MTSNPDDDICCGIRQIADAAMRVYEAEITEGTARLNKIMDQTDAAVKEYEVTGNFTATFKNDELLRQFFKSEAAFKQSMTTSFANVVRPGDRIKLSNDTNRVRRRVVDVGSATHFETATYIRPSKGFRRHLRRMKQTKH